jgi:hypothetical protein
MSKAKVEKKDNKTVITGTTDEILDLLKGEEVKPLVITNAVIKERLCNYGYEIKTGPGAGDKIPNRKGSAFIHHDMVFAFSELNIHLAIIDDAFKPLGIDDFREMENHEAIESFSVIGFKITGSEGDEGYILIGEKWVSQGGIGLETPKITATSNYPFFSELKEKVEAVRNEIELYMNGKCEGVEKMPELPFPESIDKKDNNDFENPMD